MATTLKRAAALVAICALTLGSADLTLATAAPLQDAPTQAGGKGGQRPQGGGEQADEQRRRDPQQTQTDADHAQDDAAERARGAGQGAANTPRERAPSPQDVGDPSDPETQTARRIMLEEAKHRNRLAKLHRLRELATAQGNEQRLRAIDNLELRLTEMHQRKVERAKAQLGRRFDRINERLERGRGKKAGQAGRSDDASQQRRRPDGAARGGKPGPAEKPTKSPGDPASPSGRGGKPAKDPGAANPGVGSRPGAAPPEKPAGRGEPQGRGGSDPKGKDGSQPQGKGGGKPQSTGKGGRP